MQAYIAGVTLDSNNSWDGHSSVLIFFAGCNFRCPYCYNASILSFKEEFLTETRSVKRAIVEQKVNSGMRGRAIDSVIFTGAEPSLQRQALLSIARFCKKLNLKTRLETNGTKPDSIKSLLREQLIDSVFLDIKSPPEPLIFERVTRSETFFKKTEEIISDLSETISLLKKHEKELEIEIKTNFIPQLVYKEEHFLQIASMIMDIKCTWQIQVCEIGKELNQPSTQKKDFSAELEMIRTAILKRYPFIKIINKT